MSIYWPRRPDLCNKDGRVCEKLDDYHFRLVNEDGEVVGRIWGAGDHGIVLQGLSGLTLEEVS